MECRAELYFLYLHLYQETVAFLAQEKQKVHKLDFHQELDFLLIGIISGHKDYRLCFELNKSLALEMYRCKDLVLSAGRPGSSTSHAWFTYGGNDRECYHLIGNRDLDHTGFFMPEMRNVDYFLLIHGAASNFALDKVVEHLRQIKVVSAAYEIEPAELKSAEAFLILMEN